MKPPIWHVIIKALVAALAQLVFWLHLVSVDLADLKKIDLGFANGRTLALVAAGIAIVSGAALGVALGVLMSRPLKFKVANASRQLTLSVIFIAIASAFSLFAIAPTLSLTSLSLLETLLAMVTTLGLAALLMEAIDRMPLL